MGTTHTLTGNLRDVIPGGVSTVHAAYTETNVPNGKALVDTTSDGGIAPSNVGRIPLAGDAFSLDLLGTNNTGLNVAPGTLRYRVHVEYGIPGRKGIFDWYSDWFELTADANLKTVIGELELVAPSSVADQLAARIDGVQDHGDVDGDLILNPANGYHVFDATGPTTVELGTPPGYSIAFKAITGADDVTIEGLDLELTDDQWATFVYYRAAWHLAAAGASGGGDVEPVTDPPTQPGVATFTPSDVGGTLTWLPSSVAAGYEVQTLGGVWVDVEDELELEITGYDPGDELTGFIRAYNSLGARTPSGEYRAWSGTVNTVTAHDYFLSLEPEVYLRTSQGSREDFSRIPGTWTVRSGLTGGTFDGPALVAGDLSSLRMPAGSGLERPIDGLLTGATSYTGIIVMKAVDTPGTNGKNNINYGGIAVAASANWESNSYDQAQPGGTHTYFFVWEAGSNCKLYVDERTVPWSEQGGPTSPLSGASGSDVFYVHGGMYGGSELDGGNVAYMLILKDVALDAAQRAAVCAVTGTTGNPAGGS